MCRREPAGAHMLTVMQPCRGSILVHCRQREPISSSQLFIPVLLADCLEAINAFTEGSCAICILPKLHIAY